jgi:diphthamide biosynthesis protein 2
MPVIYVFGRKPIDVPNCVAELTNSIRDSSRACSAGRVVLRCDVVYSHKAAVVAERLHDVLGCPVHHCEIPLKMEPLGQQIRNVGENQRLGAAGQVSEDVLLYIGSEGLSLTNLLVTHGTSEVRISLFATAMWETEP